MLPFVETAEGLTLTAHPAGRTICGISSGGHNYPFLVRSTPRKPIRVLIQDGVNDGRNVYGDWPLANQTMANALEFAGCDVRLEFGVGGHTLRHGGAIFADSLRWLWRDADAAAPAL